MPARKQHELSDIFDNNVNVNTRELFLCGHEGSVEDKMAVDFIKGLKILEGINQKPIIIHQYSIGGDISCGMMIYDAIRVSKCKFAIICYGAACSMGSIIPQSVHGKGLRVTTENCEWLIHEGQIFIENTYKRAKSAIDSSSTFRKKMLEIYTDVCHSSGSFFKRNSKTTVQKYIEDQLNKSDDWIFYGQDAVNFGFADYVLKPNEGLDHVLRVL